MRKFKPWGFPIDYDRAIAQDEAEIAPLLDPTYVAVCATVTEAEYAAAHARGWGAMSMFDHLTFDVVADRPRTAAERAPLCAAAGLCDAELHAAAYANDCFRIEAAIAQDGLVYQGPEFGRIGSRVYADLERRLPWLLSHGGYNTDATRKALVRHLRARLARHKRNKLKFGG